MFWQKNTFKSNLFSQRDFYSNFIQDLKDCKKEVIVESPYITSSRMEVLYPIFKELLCRGVKIHIITRDPIDHDENIRHQATNEILYSKELGMNIILLKRYHHRKIAIIDQNILWEGSLNILSYSSSQEVMRRIEGENFANDMFMFLRLNELL